MMYSGSDSNVGIIFGFKSFTPKILFHMCEQPVITWGKIWREGRMCQHIPPSTTRFCTSQWWRGVALSWSSMMPSSSSSGSLWWRASKYPPTVCSNIGHWPSYQLAWDGQAQGHFSWEPDVHDFQAPWLHCAIFFLLDFKARLSAVHHPYWGSNELIHDSSSIKIQSWNAFSLFLQWCRWVVAGRTSTGLW